MDDCRTTRRNVLRKLSVIVTIGFTTAGASGVVQGAQNREQKNPKNTRKDGNTPDGIKVIETKNITKVIIKKRMVDKNRDVIRACSDYDLAEVKDNKGNKIIKINKRKIRKNTTRMSKNARKKAEKKMGKQKSNFQRGEE